MKKNIIAMAVAAAVAAPAAAMADTTLYGKIHASYDIFGGDTVDDRDYSLSSNSSRIGLKGKEAISDNLALVYQWETTVDWGDSGNGIGSGPRNTFVGFAGDWGTAIAGRHDTPFKKVGRKYELFGDTVGDSRAIIRGRAVGGNWDLRTNNTVAYVTPDLGGFSATLAYVSDWTNDLNNEFDAYSLSAGYSIGGFMIDAGYEQHNFDGGDEQGVRVGAGYKMGGIKLVALYQNVDVMGGMEDQDAWGVGGAYSFGNSTVKAQVYMADEVSNTTDTDADLWAVGYDYKLSKQTSVYAAYAHMGQGNGVSSYAIGAGTGHGQSGPVDGSAGADSNAFSFGVVHKF